MDHAAALFWSNSNRNTFATALDDAIKQNRMRFRQAGIAEKALAGEPFEERGREITFGEGGDDDDDGLAGVSGRLPIFAAAVRAAPEEMPTGTPSSRATRRALAKASSLLTVTTSSYTSLSRMAGAKPAPMPWILCGPGLPPERTGLSAGSTATTWKPGLRAFSTWPTPVMVPPVPMPETRMSTAPSVSFQISSAVVLRWISGLAGFSNCWGMTAPGMVPASSSAMAMAPFMPFGPSVSTSSAPSRASILRRSTDMVSGMVRMRR